MKLGLIFLVSVLVIFLNGQASEATKCPSAKCVCIQNEIKCEDFESFAQLNFYAWDGDIEILDLKPKDQLILDGQLD